MLLLAANVYAAGESTFRWRGAHGLVHYSNVLPPEAVARGYEVIDGNGNVIKRVAPPMTHAQQTAAKAEAKRLAKLDADRAEQARRDNMLIRTFNSVHDIESLRDDRISALEAQLRLVREHKQGLQNRVAELQNRESKFKAKKRRIPASLHQELDELDSELADTSKTERAMDSDLADTKQRFKGDIARFKQLQAEGRIPQ